MLKEEEEEVSNMSSTLELVLAEFLLSALICVLLIRYYSGHHVTSDVNITVSLSWVLGLAGTFLLPYDISIVINGGTSSQFLHYCWGFIYWRLNSL